MYSVVLLAGLTVGSDNTPPVVVSAVPVVGCTGCTGCTGYVAGCTGYVAGCTGSCHGGMFSRLCHKHVSHGCCGGSCYGSCFGSPAMPPYGSCFSNGYTYGGYGSYYHASPAVYPMYANVPPPVVVVPVENKFVTPGTKKTDTDTKRPETDTKKPETDTKKPETDTKKTGNNGAANLKFRLPADAKLYVDGRLTNGDGSERSFFTPPLAEGQKFYYEVKAELMINGEMVTEEKRVIVAAGAEVVETFPKLTAAVEKAVAVAGK